MEKERKQRVMDIAVVIILFILGCVLGKLVMINVAETWLGFNGPALGVLGIGELVWWQIRKRLFRND